MRRLWHWLIPQSPPSPPRAPVSPLAPSPALALALAMPPPDPADQQVLAYWAAHRRAVPDATFAQFVAQLDAEIRRLEVKVRTLERDHAALEARARVKL